VKAEIQTLLSQSLAEPIRILGSAASGGGCINRTEILSLSNGRKVFLKSHSRPPQDFFRREAEGLELLRRAAGAPRVPAVLALQSAANPGFIVLEYLAEEPPAPDFYANFGRALAALHRKTQNRYGLDRDNFIGKTPQKNTPETDPIVFFREHRIRFQQALARNSGLLPAGVDRKLDKLCERLEHVLDVTGERPALLHGDLWSGNYFAGTGQAPCIFDPAAHFGLREADLAMTELFGRLPQSFYDAYCEAFPLNPGYGARKDLFNLYHLLNHLNLFGGSYLASVESVVDRFV